MQQIYSGLFIGDQNDYEGNVRFQNNWAIVHACKEPYHRAALGYTGRAAPKTHPEYLSARRGDRLILNLVDADDPAYIPKEIIDAALEFIHLQLANDKQVLVHCNQGLSRSPSIGLLYLAQHTSSLAAPDFATAERKFTELYPSYSPKAGVRMFMMRNWSHYAQRQE